MPAPDDPTTSTAASSTDAPAPGRSQRGLSISVKMILTSTLLVLLTVVGFGVMNVRTVRSVYDESARQRTEQFRDSLRGKGGSGTAMFAQALAPLLINNQDRDIAELVDDAIGVDADLQLVYVVSSNQEIITHCRVRDGAEGTAGRTCDHGAYPTTHVPVTDATWVQARAAWQAAPRQLASFDAEDGDRRLAVFAYPVFLRSDAGSTGDEREALGSVVFGYDLSPLDAFRASSDARKEQASYQSAVRTGVVGALFVLVGTLLAIVQGLSISKPIKTLVWKADQIARGDLETRVAIRSTDEIGLLGASFNDMADQLVLLLQQTAEKAVLEKELEVARTIQETLIPPADPIDRGSFRMAGHCQPATVCGGDWWTWHELGDDRILVVIGDVTGHGVPAAIITALAKAACDVARSTTANVSPARLLEVMNYAILESAKRKLVMTCFASFIDLRAHTITFANAGHQFPYLYRTAEPSQGPKGGFMALTARGNPLGDHAESRYEDHRAELVAGDVLLWYTDGLIDCQNESGEIYGEKRLRSALRAAAELDAMPIRDAILGDADRFFGTVPHRDDITLVIGKVG